MKDELTVTDTMRNAIAFCREKEITIPIADLLVEFAEQENNRLAQQLEQTKELIKDLSKYVNDCKWYVQNGFVELQKELVAKAEQFLKE